MDEIEALSQFIKPEGRCTKCMTKIVPTGPNRNELYFDWDVGKPKSPLCESCFAAGVKSRNGFY